MTDALVQISHSITLSRGISLTETGAVIDEGVSLDAWGEALQQCQSLANASIWALGDLLVYAQNHAEWGETYTQFLELTGKSYSTLTKASYLSRQYASTDRVEGLSWSHHMEAAAIISMALKGFMLGTFTSFKSSVSLKFSSTSNFLGVFRSFSRMFLIISE